jgi:hypothetical protein
MNNIKNDKYYLNKALDEINTIKKCWGSAAILEKYNTVNYNLI